MSEDATAILGHLDSVSAIRAQVASEPLLAERFEGVKSFQHARFAGTYRDLLADPAYTGAARFFLEELYGPHDFTARDAQFARIVPALVRLFPGEVVVTVRELSELHALAERLDLEMAHALVSETGLDGRRYRAAWRQVGQASHRARQISLMLDIGVALSRFTTNRWLRHSLRMMRGPARAAGLGALQQFLEAGFDTFAALSCPDLFLKMIAERERKIADVLFDPEETLRLPAEFDTLDVVFDV